jgi:hypothetical protein
MALQITTDHMTAVHNGQTLATAALADGKWYTTNWPAPLTYNQAITAMTLAEREATHGPNDPFAVSWREELTHG